MTSWKYIRNIYELGGWTTMVGSNVGFFLVILKGCFYTGGCPLKKTGAVIVPVGSARTRQEQ